MTKWLKFYATYTFYTSHNLHYRTTLLNTDVPNCHISAIFPYTRQHLLNLVEIWRSSNKNKNALFFWDTVYIQILHDDRWQVTFYRVHHARQPWGRAFEVTYFCDPPCMLSLNQCWSTIYLLQLTFLLLTVVSKC